jgi:hypothetical protein
MLGRQTDLMWGIGNVMQGGPTGVALAKGRPRAGGNVHGCRTDRRNGEVAAVHVIGHPGIRDASVSQCRHRISDGARATGNAHRPDAKGRLTEPRHRQVPIRVRDDLINGRPVTGVGGHVEASDDAVVAIGGAPAVTALAPSAKHDFAVTNHHGVTNAPEQPQTSPTLTLTPNDSSESVTAEVPAAPAGSAAIIGTEATPMIAATTSVARLWARENFMNSPFSSVAARSAAPATESILIIACGDQTSLNLSLLMSSLVQIVRC